MTLTRPQREALLRVYRRVLEADRPAMNAQQYIAFTYLKFRRTVQPTIGCDGCIMVPFAGMWLGIERDGYTHS